MPKLHDVQEARGEVVGKATQRIVEANSVLEAHGEMVGHAIQSQVIARRTLKYGHFAHLVAKGFLQ